MEFTGEPEWSNQFGAERIVGWEARGSSPLLPKKTRNVLEYLPGIYFCNRRPMCLHESVTSKKCNLFF